MKEHAKVKKIELVNSAKQFGLLTYSVLRHKLAYDRIPIFITDQCNSRCRICNIWRKQPKIDLDIEIIQNILNDKVISRYTSFILTGGEPILHPNYKEILALFQGRNYILLSNGILADRLIETVREFKVKHLSISLDGPPETYKKVRGIDNYSNIERIVKELKHDPVTINIGYTINPWNTREDLIFVMKFCKKYRVSLSIGYYGNIKYYDAMEYADHLYAVNDLLAHPYHRLYSQWASGDLNMPCLSVFLRPVIKPNGDVELCEVKEIKLGNLHEQRLEEIWHSKRTLNLQKKYFHCNDCWHDAQRPLDINVILLLKSFIPSSLLSRTFGRHDWIKIY